jgi:ketosteroid isomerase-like protein
MDSRSVVASFFACWSVQDLEMALSHLHPEVVYTLHNGPDALPFSGSYRGIDSCRDLGYTVLAQFDYIGYEPTIVSAKERVVQVHVVSRLRHRATGNVIEGSQRSVFQVDDGLITRIDIFEDAPRIEAFMKMTAQRMANTALAPTPMLPWPEKQGSAR